MTRRNIITALAAGAIARPQSTGTGALIKPPALKAGDTIGLITPATYVSDPDRVALVERTLRFLGTVDAETSAHIQHLSRALVNKLLHEPTIRIKELAHSNDVDSYMSTVCDIFGLDASQSPRDEFEEPKTQPNAPYANAQSEPSRI